MFAVFAVLVLALERFAFLPPDNRPGHKDLECQDF